MFRAPEVRPNFEFNEKVAKAFLGNRGSAGGLHEYLGFETVEVGPGTMHARFEVREELLTPIGNMHGGVLAAFCDHLLGTVCVGSHRSRCNMAPRLEPRACFVKSPRELR